jgi:hypothetical protein
MLDLSTENKALCFEDSTLKPLYIFIYYWQGEHWQYFTTIDEAIVMESMELDEGVLEGNNFELGSFVTHSMKVQWQNNGIRYKDMLAVPVQKIGDEYIAYFDGTINKEEVVENGQTVTAEISSLLSQKLDIDVLPSLKEQSGTRLPIMVYHTLNNLGVDIRTDWADRFANADYDMFLNESTLPQSLTLAEFLKQMGEFLGGHIVAQEKRVVNSLDDMTSYQPTGRLEIGFMRLANVDTVAQSNIKPLPNGYKRVEYIQTNGNQYINTGYIPTSNTKIEMQFYNFADYLSVSDPSNPIINTTALFGARTSSSENSFSLFASVYKLNEFVFDVSNSRVVIDQTPLYKQKISAQLDRITINDKTTSISAIPFECEYPLYLFSVNTAGNFDERCALGKLYSFKIYENDILQRDMIPCIRISDNKLGLYDIINGNFYVDENGSDFIAPNPIETYTLPYYINLYADKTNRVKFDQIRVLTETGDTQSGQRNYTFWWNDDVKTTYEIKNNIFFEALSTQNWEQCQNAVREVGSYLENQNLYYADLQTIYPPFVEGGDYLIVKSKNQGLLPSEYSVLESADISNSANTSVKAFVDSGIILDSDNIEIDLEFELLGGNSTILVVDGSLYGYSGFLLSASGNMLLCQIYNADSANPDAFRIPFVPLNQKIHLNLKFGNGKYQYSGTFSGNGEYDGSDVIYTKVESLLLGSGYYSAFSNYRLHHFALSQGGVKQCDMYPCLRERDSAVGMYDITQNTFKLIQGNPSPNYEIADIVVPALSTTARGIHSMRADILCKATNSNKN